MAWPCGSEPIGAALLATAALCLAATAHAEPLLGRVLAVEDGVAVVLPDGAAPGQPLRVPLDAAAPRPEPGVLVRVWPGGAGVGATPAARLSPLGGSGRFEGDRTGVRSRLSRGAGRGMGGGRGGR